MESETPEPSGVKDCEAKFAHNSQGKSLAAASEIPDKPRKVAKLDAAARAFADLKPDTTPAAFPEKIPKAEFDRMVRRLEGYTEGVFANGIPCFLMAELTRRFAKARGYSLKHVQDVGRAWMRWTSKFAFKRQRLGRSTCIVISPRSRKLILSRSEVRRRLAGSIRSYVAKSGGVDVGRKFLENFHSRYGLPPEDIFYAWSTLHWLDGCLCRWIGRGNGRKFVVRTAPASARATHARQMGGRAKNLKFTNAERSSVERNSLPGNASGISPLPGEMIRKQERPAAPDSQTESSGSLREHLGGRVGEERPGTPTGADDQIPSGERRRWDTPPNRATMNRVSHRWKPTLRPLQVCDRWIAAARIRSKANFLAFGPMQNAHVEFHAVRFRIAHAVNFADDALRAGFVDSQICAAYRAGLERSHASALRDREAAENRDYWAARERGRSGEFLREPSQTVSVAWEILRADTRTDAERWAAIFRGDVAPELRDLGVRVPEPGAATPAAAQPAPVPPRSSAKPSPSQRAAGSWRTIGPGLRVRAEYLRDETPKPRDTTPTKKIVFGKKGEGHAVEYRDGPDLTAALKNAAAKAPQTVEAHMRARGLTLDALLKLPRAEQQKFVRDAIAAQRKAGDSSQTLPFANDSV